MRLRFVSVSCVNIAIAMLLLSAPAVGADAPNPYLGSWALTIPGGAAGWLGVTQEKDGRLSGSLLWGGGSVLPLAGVKLEGGTLILTRISTSGKKDADGKPLVVTETITARADGDDLKLTIAKTKPYGTESAKVEFTGKRTPPLPPAPDLSKVTFGPQITLFNGKDLTGWKLTNSKAINGWSVKEGVLVNQVVRESGNARRFGNLGTDQEFEDFNLTCQTNVPKGGNSGVFLRGIYEVQVFDSYGKPLDSHNMGAIYSRITPTEAAEKPAGEWQTLDVTLVGRHVTVILNGRKIIDNQPIPGCTGGALWSDPIRPGPIYLQGNHTSANFRNIVIRPVVKK